MSGLLLDDGRVGPAGSALRFLGLVLADEGEDLVGLVDEGVQAGVEEREDGPALVFEQGFGGVSDLGWDAGAVALVHVATDHTEESRMWLAIYALRAVPSGPISGKSQKPRGRSA